MTTTGVEPRRREPAEALGMRYQTVGHLERSQCHPTLQLALRIAAFFDVPLEAIVSLEPFPRISDVARTA